MTSVSLQSHRWGTGVGSWTRTLVRPCLCRAGLGSGGTLCSQLPQGPLSGPHPVLRPPTGFRVTSAWGGGRRPWSAPTTGIGRAPCLWSCCGCIVTARPPLPALDREGPGAVGPDTCWYPALSHGRAHGARKQQRVCPQDPPRGGWAGRGGRWLLAQRSAPPRPPADCRAGFFGPGCALRCDCGGGAGCDPVSGRCHCVDGYTGPTCRQGESGSWGGRTGTLCPNPTLAQAHPSPCSADRSWWSGVPMASDGQSVTLQPWT